MGNPTEILLTFSEEEKREMGGTGRGGKRKERRRGLLFLMTSGANQLRISEEDRKLKNRSGCEGSRVLQLNVNVSVAPVDFSEAAETTKDAGLLCV